MVATILIIEDSSDLRADVIDMLSLEGYNVIEAVDGVEGIEIAVERSPDLILCDVMMPRMDGYKVLETLRSRPDTVTIPFVFLTSRAEHDSQRYGMKLGADDYLPKPFLVADLLDTIRTQLKKLDDIRAVADKQLEDLRMNIITAMPHELRTPLNTILGFSEMLLLESQHIKPEQIAEWSQHIYDAGTRLMRMTENYLVYARVSVALNDPLEKARFREERLVSAAELLTMQAQSTAARHSRIASLVIDAEPVSLIHCSHTHFTKVVDELVDNACKFSNPDTRITLTATVQPPYYVIQVGDSGRGINPEYISRLGAYMQFDRWFYEQQGTGLGLGIVMQMVRLHEGTFDIASAATGTSVTVRFRVE